MTEVHSSALRTSHALQDRSFNHSSAFSVVQNGAIFAKSPAIAPIILIIAQATGVLTTIAVGPSSLFSPKLRSSHIRLRTSPSVIWKEAVCASTTSGQLRPKACRSSIR